MVWCVQGVWNHFTLILRLSGNRCCGFWALGSLKFQIRCLCVKEECGGSKKQRSFNKACEQIVFQRLNCVSIVDCLISWSCFLNKHQKPNCRSQCRQPLKQKLDVKCWRTPISCSALKNVAKSCVYIFDTELNTGSFWLMTVLSKVGMETRTCQVDCMFWQNWFPDCVIEFFVSYIETGKVSRYVSRMSKLVARWLYWSSCCVLCVLLLFFVYCSWGCGIGWQISFAGRWKSKNYAFT